jgi:uncharacterized membrane protein
MTLANGDRIVSLAMVLLAGAGIVVSAYLTTVHYSDAPLVCSSGGVVDCERVLTSSYSEVLGLPWSLGGVVWFTVSGGLAVIAWLRAPEPEWLQPGQLVWSLLGLAVALYLIGVEVVEVEKICLWCSVLHLLIVLMLLLTLLRTPQVAETVEA